jgi:RHS repeat-associated protein
MSGFCMRPPLLRSMACAALLLAGATASWADTQTRTVNNGFAAYSASSPATTLLPQNEVLQPGDSSYQLTTSYTYDANGNRIATVASGPNVAHHPSSSTTYDPSGRFPATSTNAAGQTTSFAYNPVLGLLVGQTDPNGLTATFTYDAWGRKTLEVRPDGNRTAYAYRLCNALSAGEPACPTLAVYVVETTPQNASGTQNGPIGAVYYDKLDRVVRKAAQSESDFSSLVWSLVDTTYDNLGRTVSTTQPYYAGATPTVASTLTYDAIGRVIQTTAADSSCQATTYAVGVKTVTDMVASSGCTAASAMTTTYSDSHVVTKVVDAANNPTSYKFDAFGNLLSITDPSGNVSSATYNIRGWRMSATDPDAGATAATYDALGQKLTSTDATGATTTFSYDSLGRMYQRVNGTQTTDTWNYDTAGALGQLLLSKRYSGVGTSGSVIASHSYTYDSLVRLSTEAISANGASSDRQTFKYSYNSDGRLASVTRPSGLVLSYGYNARGRLISISNGSQPVWNAQTADAAGRIIADQVGGGVLANTRAYDTNRAWLDNISTVSTGSSLINQAISHATNGLVTGRSDAATGLSESFTYDSLHRLIGSSGTLTNTLGIVSAIPSKTYSYDALGNISNKSDVGNYTYGSKPHAVTSVASAIYGYSYDAAGRMISGQTSIGMPRTLTYDASGMVASVSVGSLTVSYSYGSDGQRTLQTTPTEIDHYYSFAATSHAEYRALASGGAQWVDYLHGPGGIIGAIYTNIAATGAKTTTVSYFAQDHLGSIAATVTQSGSSWNIAQRSYDGFGKQRFTTGQDDVNDTLTSVSNSPNTDVRGYIAQEQVAGTGLINLNARMYDPWLGRFLQVDPMIGSIYNLQALNPYSYVMNNPLTDADPTGMCSFWACPFRQIFGKGTWFGRNAQILTPIVAIVAVVTFQYEVFPALVGADSFGAMSFGLQAADVAISGAVGGAINTGSLRGALIGAATAEAFWGAGQIAPAMGIGSTVGNVVASSAFAATVGCASAAASGGKCANGAISAGLGSLIQSTAGTRLGDDMFTRAAIAGLGGGTGAALTGGRFGDGFYTAALGSIENDVVTRGLPSALDGLADYLNQGSPTLQADGAVASQNGPYYNKQIELPPNAANNELGGFNDPRLGLDNGAYGPQPTLQGAPSSDDFQVAATAPRYNCVNCGAKNGGTYFPYCPSCYLKSLDPNGGVVPIVKIPPDKKDDD